MTDREILMLLYGAIKPQTDEDGVVQVEFQIGDILKRVEDHLWPEGQNENETSPKSK